MGILLLCSTFQLFASVLSAKAFNLVMQGMFLLSVYVEIDVQWWEFDGSQQGTKAWIKIDAKWPLGMLGTCSHITR